MQRVVVICFLPRVTSHSDAPSDAAGRRGRAQGRSANPTIRGRTDSGRGLIPVHHTLNLGGAQRPVVEAHVIDGAVKSTGLTTVIADEHAHSSIRQLGADPVLIQDIRRDFRSIDIDMDIRRGSGPVIRRCYMLSDAKRKDVVRGPSAQFRGRKVFDKGQVVDASIDEEHPSAGGRCLLLWRQCVRG